MNKTLNVTDATMPEFLTRLVEDGVTSFNKPKIGLGYTKGERIPVCLIFRRTLGSVIIRSIVERPAGFFAEGPSTELTVSDFQEVV
jgi:hypothetical protein